MKFGPLFLALNQTAKGVLAKRLSPRAAQAARLMFARFAPTPPLTAEEK